MLAILSDTSKFQKLPKLNDRDRTKERIKNTLIYDGENHTVCDSSQILSNTYTQIEITNPIPIYGTVILNNNYKISVHTSTVTLCKFK